MHLDTEKIFSAPLYILLGLQKFIFMFIWKIENPIFDRSHFLKLGKQDKDSIKSCCPIQMKTGVQIIGGLLAVLSGTVLVLFFAMLDEIIGRKYFQIYEVSVKIHCSILCLIYWKISSLNQYCFSGIYRELLWHWWLGAKFSQSWLIFCSF